MQMGVRRLSLSGNGSNAKRQRCGRVWMVSCLALFCVLQFTAGLLSAAPPAVTALFPAGGQQGTELKVTLQGTVNTEELKLWSNLPGLELVGPDGKDAIKVKLAADAPRGRRWLRFYSAEGASAPRSFAVDRLPELQEVEPNDRDDKAQAVAQLPVIINGSLNKGGKLDAYSVALTAGQTLVARLAARQEFGSPMDGVLQIADSRGFVLLQNDDDDGFDPRLVFKAPHDGTYVVRVFAFPAQPDTSIRFSGAAGYVYRLLLTNGPLIEHLLPAAVSGLDATTVRGEGVNLPADLAPLPIAAGPPGLEKIDWAGGPTTAVILRAGVPVVTEVEPNSLQQAPALMSGPVCVTGTIANDGDRDAWKFTSTKGRGWQVRGIATALHSPLDLVVRIYDAKGGMQFEFDDAPRDEDDLVATFNTPADGEYILVVMDRYDLGTPQSKYAVFLSEPAADCRLTLAADQATVKQNEMVEVVVNIDRRNGFAQPLEIAIEGLPEGCTAEVAKSEPKGDSSKSVKLQIKSTREEGWSGPLKIVGRSTGEPKLERVAAFVLEPVGDRLDAFWLTVVGKPK